MSGDGDDAPAGGRTPVVVSTPLGDVEGLLRASDNIETFLGMPYAEPPVGPLRFMPAQTKTAWTDTVDAHEYGHRCLQGALFGSGSKWGSGSEDCLLVAAEHQPTCTRCLDEKASK